MTTQIFLKKRVIGLVVSSGKKSSPPRVSSLNFGSHQVIFTDFSNLLFTKGVIHSAKDPLIFFNSPFDIEVL